MLLQAIDRCVKEFLCDRDVEAAHDDRKSIAPAARSRLLHSSPDVHGASGKKPAAHDLDDLHRDRVRTEGVVVVLLSAVEI